VNAVARRLPAVHAHPAHASRTGASWSAECRPIDLKVETEMPETDLVAGVVAE